MTTDRDTEAMTSPDTRPSKQAVKVREAEIKRARKGIVKRTRKITSRLGMLPPEPVRVKRPEPNVPGEVLASLQRRYAQLLGRDRTGLEHREMRELESELARCGRL